jgi:hypothetical protein
MKAHLVRNILLSFLVAGVLVASYAGYSAYSTSTYAFTMTVSGWAHDPHTNKNVAATISLTGTAVGDITKIYNLYIKSGDATVQNYGHFTISSGYGTLVQNSHYIFLGLKLTGGYGGYLVLWYLTGSTGALLPHALPVSFTSSQVILPLWGDHSSWSLGLTGSIVY